MDFLNQSMILLPIALIGGAVCGFFIRKRFVEGHLANINAQGKQIVETAIVEAEQIKKENLLKSKQAVYKQKQAAEEEIKQPKVSLVQRFNFGKQGNQQRK